MGQFLMIYLDLEKYCVCPLSIIIKQCSLVSVTITLKFVDICISRAVRIMKYRVAVYSYKNKVWRAGLSWIFRARMAWWGVICKPEGAA